MTIMTEDGGYVVSVGGSMMLYSLYSTVKCRIPRSEFRVGIALKFLQSGQCHRKNVVKGLEQLKIIKSKLTELKVTEMVYNCNDLEEDAPWGKNIDDEVHSCMDLFTTDDGRNLIDELISILEYAKRKDLSIVLP